MDSVEQAQTQLVAAGLMGLPIDTTPRVTAEHFDDMKARQIWQACQDLNDEGQQRTLLSVQRQLARNGASVTFDDLLRFDSRDVLDVHVSDAAGVLDESYTRRRLRECGAWLIDASRDHSLSISDIVGEAWQRLFSIDAHKQAKIVDMRDVLITAMETSRAMARKETVGAPTGFARLDRALNGGVYPGQQIVIGGRPKNGKSAFALQTLLNVARKQIPGLFIGLEMQNIEQGRRIMANQAGVPMTAFFGHAKGHDYSAMSSVIDDTMGYQVAFTDRCFTLNDVVSAARDWRRRHKTQTAVIVVDYLQLLSAGHKVASREQEISQCSRRLKQLAQELECTTIVLSQLNRAADARADKRPTMSDLRESGAIEQDADVVLLVWRPWMMQDRTQSPNAAFVRVAANRSGEGGIDIPMHFGMERMTFEELPQ